MRQPAAPLAGTVPPSFVQRPPPSLAHEVQPQSPTIDPVTVLGQFIGVGVVVIPLLGIVTSTYVAMRSIVAAGKLTKPESRARNMTERAGLVAAVLSALVAVASLFIIGVAVYKAMNLPGR